MILLLTSESECSVHFEPEGSDHLLAPGDAFRVELSSPPEHFEIAHSPGALSIWTQGCEIRAWNREGAELRL